MGSGVTLYLTLNKELAELNRKNVKAKDQLRDTLKMVLPKDTQEEELPDTPAEPVAEETASDDEPVL